MANKYGRYGLPVPWEAIKTLWCSGEKTNPEIGKLFGVVPNSIATRARREGWHALRDKVFRELAGESRVIDPASLTALRREKDAGDKSNMSRMGISSNVQDSSLKKPPLGQQEIVRKAIELSSATRFKERVIAANDKALIVLENTEVCNVAEVDRFAEALTKVERIGARAFGYDREVEVPAINIGILTSGSEYTND